MNIVLRSLAGILVALTVACGGGSSGGSGGNGNAAAVQVFPANGDYVGLGTFVTNIRVVDLGSNTPPIDNNCVGNIDVVIDDAAADVISGNGQCSTGGNSATYSVVGGFVNGDVDFEGEISIVFSRVTHVLPISGTRNGDRIEASFAGRTPQVGNLVIDWDGNFSADR